MKKIYDYVCKNCWQQWRMRKQHTNCPRCNSTNIYYDEDILLAEE